MISPPAGSFVLGFSAFVTFITLCSNVFPNKQYITFSIIIGFIVCLFITDRLSKN